MYSIFDSVSAKLLDELGIEALVEGETKEFKLTTAGVYNPAVGVKINPAGYITPGRCVIKDPYAKKTLQGTYKPNLKLSIFHYTDFDPIVEEGRPTAYKGIEEYLRWQDTGVRVVTAMENETYAFAMLNNKRRDNPNRIVGAAPKWYLVDEKRDQFDEVTAFEYKIKAGTLLGNFTDEEILALGLRFNSTRKEYFVDINNGPMAVRHAAISFISNDARGFLLFLGTKAVKTQVLIDELLADRTILFDETKRNFFWRGGKAKDTICHVEVGNKPNSALVDFALGPDGGAFYAELKVRDEARTSILV